MEDEALERVLPQSLDERDVHDARLVERVVAGLHASAVNTRKRFLEYKLLFCSFRNLENKKHIQRKQIARQNSWSTVPNLVVVSHQWLKWSCDAGGLT